MAEDEENLNPMPEPPAREGDAFFARFSIRTPVFSFSFSLKIADQRLATTVVVGCGVALAAFLYRYPESVGSAVRSALEGPGLQVQNIISSSIIVRMRCDGEERLLEIVENFEKKKVKKKLEQAFRKIGCLKESEELVVTIMDKENVHRKVDEIRY